MARNVPGRKTSESLNGNGRYIGHTPVQFLRNLLPSKLARDETIVIQHIREGRFQRSLALITSFSSLLSGLEVTYEHYLGSYSQQIMYTPVFISLALVVSGIGATFNRWMARVALPIVSLSTVINGMIGFFLHVRGIHRKPGGWRIPIFNIVMGPPLLAPLLFATSGFLGLITTFLRREDDLPPTAHAQVRSTRARRPLWQDMLPREITQDISTIEQDI